MNLKELSRREFLRRGSLLSMAGAAAPWALNLATLAEASAAVAPVGDYKALVCVFLSGGNDNANTLIPADAANYALYQQIRGDIALPLSDLAATTLTPAQALPGGRQMALAPGLAALKPMFDAGQMAVLLNVGPLVQPTTVADFKASRVPLPPKLFSHNDQQSVWQSSSPEGAITGWGGRIGDLFLSSNNRAAFTCVNVAGNAVYLSGQNAIQYMVSPSGAAPLGPAAGRLYGSAECSALFKSLVTQDTQSHVLASEHARVMQRAIEAQSELSTALASVPEPTTVFNTTGNTLAAQLKMVARLISARQPLGLRRQVFFVSLGGFDHHDNLLSQHPILMAKVADALKSFHAATAEMGVDKQVTSFTASDFGRTLSSNGDGSDHGWGSYHFVLGGAVNGRNFYGQAPEVSVGGANDVGQGRLVPTMAVDQLSAELGRWMGISSAADLSMVAPHMASFDKSTLAGLFTPAA
jgi:uncharacterized protein (DUF1501 family)